VEATNNGHNGKEHQDILAGENKHTAPKAEGHDFLLEAGDSDPGAFGQHAKALWAVMNNILEEREYHRHNAQRCPVQDQ